jgi:hypothetical protein
MSLKEIHSVLFTYDYPLIYLHLVEILLGEPLLKQLERFEFPPRHSQWMNPDSTEMLILRSKIDERFFPCIMALFDMLGEVDPELTKDWKWFKREAC